MRRRRDALFGIIDNWVILIGLIVRGSTRRYRHDLNQVGQVLGFGFLVGFTTSEKARDACRASVERLLNGVHSLV